MSDNHPFYKMLQNIRAIGVNATQIKLQCIAENALNDVTSDVLCLSPRVVRPLSSILFTKTKGNVLFFIQILLSLHRDGLLYLDYSRHCWAWDQEKILSEKLPDNIAICFTNGIRKLPVEVQLAMHTMSVFGASVKLQYIQALEAHLKIKIVEPLKIAAAEGLVSELNGWFNFNHDRIQEASYNMIGDRDRRCNHLIYGKCLVKLALQSCDDDMLFVAVGQINMGGKSVAQAQECFLMAQHNLTAGKKAMGMSEFMSAYSFFEHGIDFLPEHHWRRDYPLCLDIYTLACKSAFAVGKMQALRILSEHVLTNARSFKDTLEVQLTKLSMLAHSSQASEALNMGLAIVSNLGEDIPKPSKEALDVQVQQTQALIRGLSEDQLIRHRLMTDLNKLYVMKFLARLQIISYLVNSPIHPFVILKVRFVLDHLFRCELAVLLTNLL
jgi:predicted ATPase